MSVCESTRCLLKPASWHQCLLYLAKMVATDIILLLHTEKDLILVYLTLCKICILSVCSDLRCQCLHFSKLDCFSRSRRHYFQGWSIWQSKDVFPLSKSQIVSRRRWYDLQSWYYSVCLEFSNYSVWYITTFGLFKNLPFPVVL